MPIKIRHAFEREYGRKKGDRIFYAWENKHHMLEPRRHIHNSAQLVLRGNRRYISHMFNHLKHEHPSTKRRMRMM